MLNLTRIPRKRISNNPVSRFLPKIMKRGMLTLLHSRVKPILASNRFYPNHSSKRFISTADKKEIAGNTGTNIQVIQQAEDSGTKNHFAIFSDRIMATKENIFMPLSPSATVMTHSQFVDGVPTQFCSTTDLKGANRVQMRVYKGEMINVVTRDLTTKEDASLHTKNFITASVLHYLQVEQHPIYFVILRKTAKIFKNPSLTLKEQRYQAAKIIDYYVNKILDVWK